MQGFLPYNKVRYVQELDENMDPERLSAFNKAAITSLVLWLSLCETEWHAAKLREWEALEGWLVQAEKPVMYEKQDQDEELWWPAIQGPDICGTCYSFFGFALGGRVREGCMHCQDRGTFKYYIYHMRDWLYVNDAHMEWLLASALFKWSRIKPRQQARTQKWIKDNDARLTQEGVLPLEELSSSERDRIRELEADLEEL